jgi:serine/threonine protein kinase/tetratricopeptide (TPR) repeat protein
MSTSARVHGPEVNGDESLGRIVERLTRRLQKGEPLDLSELARQYPAYAGQLAEVWPALQALADLERAASEVPGGGLPQQGVEAHGELGDFRILRQVGRGGMGIVYEAEQISLNRPVALKVLPFASTLDARQLQRFKNEAQAAAALHHTNIVPVFATGCERGVHYYAMQFIDGHTVADLISELRRPAEALAPHVEPTGPYLADRDATPPAATLPTERTARSPAHFRTVARLGVQAAEALEHAHQLGIVHRDIKPGNLLVDVRGNLWVTDFGLAHCQSQAGLTMTGDLVGTLRYMSPEQALAKRVPIDHRTDIYSLGATLYELLTLAPVFSGGDREELLRQIAFEEPRKPRRLNKAIPPELETIVLKALEKNPAERYATAQDLADDLGRWLKDEPIRARRPSLVLRARKWARRHRPVVAGSAAVILAGLIFALVLAFSYERRRAATKRAVTTALARVETLLDQGDKQTDNPEQWQATARLAEEALESAEKLLATGEGTDELRAQVREVRTVVKRAVTDSQMLVTLDQIRLEQTTFRNETFDRAVAAALYAKALGGYGVDLEAPEAAVALVRGSRLQVALLGALEDWLRVTKNPREQKQLWRVLHAIELEPDAFRVQWWAATQHGDAAKLLKLAKEASAQRLSATTVSHLATDLRRVSEWTAAERLLRAAQERQPGDFWLNTQLAVYLIDPGRSRERSYAYHPPDPSRRSRAEEAIGYLRAALALRSNNPGAHLNLGTALSAKGDLEAAIREYRAALHIERNYAAAHYNLGSALFDQGHQTEAESAYREAIRLKPEYAEAHSELAVLLASQGKKAEAIREYREAIRIRADLFQAHYNLARILLDQGDFTEAIKEYRAVISLQPNHARAHLNLGVALKEKRQLEAAIQEYQIALKIDPSFAMAHNNLGVALREKGKLADAIQEYRKALQIDPKLALAHNNLGNALLAQGDREAAIRAYQAALQIDPRYGTAQINLAAALRDGGNLAAAIEEFRAALQINPKFAEAYCEIGLALVQLGQFRQALQELRRGHELGSKNPRWPYPSGQWLREAERMADLDARLPKILKGEDQPAGAGERMALAFLCQTHKKLYAAAARWYGEAFAAQRELAEDLRSGSRYNAACAAALAGCGQGQDAKDLDDAQRARLRAQALQWLRADLAAWSMLLEKDKEKAAPVVRQQMKRWLVDPDLARMRGADALARLPAAERQPWQKLWADVKDTLNKLR